MRTKIEYPWYLRTGFIMLLAALFWLVIPIPIMIFLLIRRLEYRQLCRMIIAKLLSIDFYMDEIAELEGRKQMERFKRSFEIKEVEYQELNKLQEELHREYDLLVFRKVLADKIKENPFHKPNVHSIQDEFEGAMIDTIQVDVENEKRSIKDKIEKRRQEEDLEELKQIKERKRAKKVRKLREERKMNMDTENRSGEEPFFREEPQPVEPEEVFIFEDEAVSLGDEKPATPEPQREAGFSSESSLTDEANVCQTEVLEAHLPPSKEEPIPEPVVRPKQRQVAASKPSINESESNEHKKDRVRPVMQGNRVYLSFDDFEDDF